MFLAYFLSFVLSCQYQCKWLPGKARLRNDLLCVKQEVKLLTQSLLFSAVRCYDTLITMNDHNSTMFVLSHMLLLYMISLSLVKLLMVLYAIYRLVFLQHREECLRLRSHSTLMPMVLSTFQLETRELAKNNRVGHLTYLVQHFNG